MNYKTINIKSMTDLIKQIVKFAQDHEEVWYRGHKFEYYHLEPSAYRYEPFSGDGVKKGCSQKTEARSLMAAKSGMLHISETHRLEKNIDWLCYLQHNSLPTRLLDWTVEFSVSLYFAFEDYLQNKSLPGSIPCLWALKPGKFMDAIASYINNPKINLPFDIPDLKIKAEIASEIFADKRPKDTSFISESDKKYPELDNIYVPFFSPYVNERAKLQGGCFIRFPLLNEKLKNEFYEHRLEEFVRKDVCFSDCLRKFVFIQPSTVANDLSMLNLKTSRIYPEVENISLAIKKRFFEL
jgi:hypothetical protein